MKKLISATFLVAIFSMTTAYAAEHHSGHGGGQGGGGGSAGACMKPRLSNFTPGHLAKVAPESEISFKIINIDNPDQISITIKEISVEFDSEFKAPFYLIKAKLPASLRNTAARINIRVNAKYPQCEGEDGWLVLISG
ncbi:MAG: hypothetical protein PHH59_14090 [Methylovulum sp.]|uniref:hypothetical protein n=1 Tax=Methylovulum sp. TaxID=1916980 RepID=UPI00260BE648|nr:hypothetical protein [Methylovulum sp.]MDD2725135.1 hypothetical protein [Methylovulum sp.]MDD5126015.1 hypothetical protein [Methylovulum sp.]